jgi:hypothetical protein
MRDWIRLCCLALMLAVSPARGDILPTPDRGPPMGTAGGLDFAVESVQVEMHGYSKTQQVAVLVGCTDGHPNCKLARARNLIGMEVQSVDGQDLRTENGMVRQIMDAFERKDTARTVILELYSRRSNSEPVKVAFAR